MEFLVGLVIELVLGGNGLGQACLVAVLDLSWASRKRFFLFIFKNKKNQKYMPVWEYFKNMCLSPRGWATDHNRGPVAHPRGDRTNL